MSRLYTDELINQLVTRLPDNQEGLITPEALRLLAQDIIMSLRPAYAILAGDHVTTPVAFATADSWGPIAGEVYWSTVGQSDPVELEANAASGAAICHFPSFLHEAAARLAFTGEAGVEYQFALGLNGVVARAPQVVDGAGATRLLTVVGDTFIVPADGDQIQLMVRSVGAASSINIYQQRLDCQLVTSRRPV